jgi:hypothetical protein
MQQKGEGEGEEGIGLGHRVNYASTERLGASKHGTAKTERKKR